MLTSFPTEVMEKTSSCPDAGTESGRDKSGTCIRPIGLYPKFANMSTDRIASWIRETADAQYRSLAEQAAKKSVNADHLQYTGRSGRTRAQTKDIKKSRSDRQGSRSASPRSQRDRSASRSPYRRRHRGRSSSPRRRGTSRRSRSRSRSFPRQVTDSLTVVSSPYYRQVIESHRRVVHSHSRHGFDYPRFTRKYDARQLPLKSGWEPSPTTSPELAPQVPLATQVPLAPQIPPLSPQSPTYSDPSDSEEVEEIPRFPSQVRI